MGKAENNKGNKSNKGDKVVAKLSEYFEAGFYDDTQQDIYGTYAAFNLAQSSAQKLYNWASRFDIPNIVMPEEMHVTTVYSKNPIDYQSLGILKEPIILEPNTYRLRVFRTDDANVLVLSFQNEIVERCWRRARNMGASWDFPSYIPHITVSSDLENKNDIDLLKAIPPTFEIKLVEEYTEPLKP